MGVLRDIMLVFAALLATCLTGGALHLGLGGLGGVTGAFQNALVSAIFYTPLCAFIALGSLRIMRSPALFTLLSTAAAFGWAVIKLQQAAASKTVVMYGYTLYVDGQPTPAGMIYELVTPLTLMAAGGALWCGLYRQARADQDSKKLSSRIMTAFASAEGRRRSGVI